MACPITANSFARAHFFYFGHPGRNLEIGKSGFSSNLENIEKYKIRKLVYRKYYLQYLLFNTARNY